jgi:hypothetical protein
MPSLLKDLNSRAFPHVLKTLLRKDIHSIVTDIPERAMEFRESIQDV